MGYSKTLEIGATYVASDTLLSSNDAEKNVAVGVYTKIKSFRIIQEIYANFQLRAKADLYCGAGINYTRSKIYLNGVAVGVEQQNIVPGTWGTVTDDVTFTGANVNDEIEIWCLSALSNGKIRNFRLYGTEAPFYQGLV